jgi:hypothetical protein
VRGRAGGGGLAAPAADSRRASVESWVDPGSPPRRPTAVAGDTVREARSRAADERCRRPAPAGAAPVYVLATRQRFAGAHRRSSQPRHNSISRPTAGNRMLADRQPRSLDSTVRQSHASTLTDHRTAALARDHAIHPVAGANGCRSWLRRSSWPERSSSSPPARRELQLARPRRARVPRSQHDWRRTAWEPSLRSCDGRGPCGGSPRSGPRGRRRRGLARRGLTAAAGDRDGARMPSPARAMAAAMLVRFRTWRAGWRDPCQHAGNPSSELAKLRTDADTARSRPSAPHRHVDRAAATPPRVCRRGIPSSHDNGRGDAHDDSYPGRTGGSSGLAGEGGRWHRRADREPHRAERGPGPRADRSRVLHPGHDLRCECDEGVGAASAVARAGGFRIGRGATRHPPRCPRAAVRPARIIGVIARHPLARTAQLAGDHLPRLARRRGPDHSPKCALAAPRPSQPRRRPRPMSRASDGAPLPRVGANFALPGRQRKSATTQSPRVSAAAWFRSWSCASPLDAQSSGRRGSVCSTMSATGSPAFSTTRYRSCRSTIASASRIS